MISERYLKDLLAILKTHHVKHIKMQGLELLFHEEHEKGALETPCPKSPPSSGENGSLENIADALKKQEEALPIDLRADSLMDQDKILNWSSPDQSADQPELPLTGEQAL